MHVTVGVSSWGLRARRERKYLDVRKRKYHENEEIYISTALQQLGSSLKYEDLKSARLKIIYTCIQRLRGQAVA
jgi:hypothetical protein